MASSVLPSRSVTRKSLDLPRIGKRPVVSLLLFHWLL
uniref:Uncharacterized protein n=1 Tax=Anguilla anguilla TaxID=7936 RepID=A0A0E9WIU4_ANGAN